MLSHKPLNVGDLRGTIFSFELAGDILPKHTHGPDNVHITIVSRGRVKAYSHDWEIEASAGGILDFRPNEPHEIMALEDDTRIVNIVKKYSGSDSHHEATP